LLQYGIAIYEGADHTVTADQSCTDEDCLYRMNTAEKAWLKSVSLKPSVWGYRNLAVLEAQRGDFAAAEVYYDRAIALPGAFDDHALAAEYLDFLAKCRRYEKLWEIYEALPLACREKDRVDICAAFAAVRIRKIDFLDGFFKRDHHDIREGEESLTDIWFTYSAYKLAAERGIADPDNATLDQLIDEAWDCCPPPEDIDFRMSLDRENRYRI
jgi:tetratricopeptide (TPR) repeat protein